jgi:hypothetical protein
LNGEEEQVIAVKDESGSWWQYEFDRQSGAWVEKSLPEVSTNVNYPTRLEWNDIISGRWAVAVRQAIKEGKIPTFDPSKLTDVRFKLDRDELFERYGVRTVFPKLGAPDYLDLRRPGSFPIIYSAYAVMEIDGEKIGILTEQIAIDKNGDFVLFNLYGPPEPIQYQVSYGRRPSDNVRSFFAPAVEFKRETCEKLDITKQFCKRWIARFVSNIIREMIKRWVKNGEGLDPKLIERLLMWAVPLSY